MSLRTLMHPFTYLLAICLAGTGCQPCMYAASGDYGRIMQAAVKHSLGNDFREYEWLSYPTNNFGVATMFVLENQREKPGDRNQWCATFTCLGLEGKQAPADRNARLTAGGYADVGTGGPISVSDEDSRILAGDMFLPGILNVLGLGQHLAVARSARVTLRMGNVSRRILRRPAILAYLDSLPASSPLRRAMSENRLAMVVADAVIDSLEVDIDLQGTESGGLAAKLTPLTDHTSGGSATMLVTVKRDRLGQYRLIISQPVIIARLTMRRALTTRDTQERPAQLPAGLGEWETWVPAGAAANVQ